MAILDLLKRTKKRIDDAIPDFNLTQKAGNVLRQANQIRQNLPIAQEGRRLTDMLAAQRERQAEQARLRQEREIQARERRMEESKRRIKEMRAKEQERNRQREENQRKLREATSAVGKFAANIPQEIGAGLLRSGAIAADTGVKALQKGEDIITAPLGKGYKEKLTKLRQAQSKKEDELLGRLQTKELKKGEGVKNYLRETFNKALPEIKNVKQSTPLQRGAAVADIGLTLLAPGVGNVLKEAGKQGAKQVAKQYAKTAALGAAGGAAGTATQKDATAGDITKGAIGGAVFGAGLKGAGDVAPVVARKAGSTLSKAKEGVASALQEPKFKPGFASTQPKVEIVKDPTKRQQIINSVLEGDLTLRAKKFNNRKLSPEELSVVQKSVDSGLEKLGIKSVKEIRNIEGFTPAPEVKKPETISTSSLIKEAQERLQTKVKQDINPQVKRLQNLGATEKEASDLIKSVGFDKAQNALASIKDAPDVKNRGGLAYNIATGKTKPREISKPLTEFGDFTPEGKLKSDIKVPTPEVKPTIKLATTQEPKQPTVKLQTETPIIPRTPRQLAEEAVQRATKKPISPEIAPVARVSTKEDISVGKTPELNDRFLIKTPASGKTRIDYDKLIDFGTKINDEKSKNALLNRIGLEAERIGAEYTKKTGKGFDSFVDELESGKLDNRVVDLYDEVSNLFNAGNRISTVRNNQITGNIANYFRRIKKEGLEKILTEGSQKNVADILYTPGFAKKRTGALVEYEKTPSVLKAYFDEAIGPISSEQNALVRTANQIKNQIDKSEIVDKDGVIKPTSGIKYVQTIKNNVQATAQNQYNNVKKAIIPGVRSVKNRVFQLADKKFYDDFLKPFNNAQRDYNNALQNATKLSEKNVRNLAESLGIKVSEKTSKDQMLQRIAGEYKKQYYGPATETFIKNVANADIREPNGLQLLEDIAETYIGTEVKKNNFIDKLSGEVRLAYARGALGLNVGSAINNVLELKKVLSRSGIGNTAGAIKDYMSGVDLRNKYGVATTSNIFQDEAFGLLKKVDPALFSLFDFSENTKNRLFLFSLERLGKKKGLQGDDLEYFVLKNFEQYGLAGGRAEDIGLFTGGKRPLTKTAFQFLQYPIKDTVAFADALSNGLKKAVKDKKLNEDLSYAMVYGITSVAQMAILSQIIGQKGFGSQSGFTPFDFLKQISSGDVTGPGADAILKLGTWVNEIMQPESDKKEENVRKAQADMNRTFLMGVVPAYNQIWNRTGKYIQDRNRGYFETGSGNVANLVTDDTWGAIRAYILGGSYDPERQKYFVESQRSKSPNLGKQESAIFREVKERGGIESAKQYFNSILGKREADKALKSLEEGANAQKPAGMSDEEWTKIKATNEAYILSGLATTDDFINYYARDIEFGKSGAERTKNETKVFALVNQLDSEEKFKKLSPEQKEDVSNKLLEKAGIKRDIVDYYNKSKNSVVVKYQMALEEIEDNLSKNPNFDIFNYLKEGRKKINTKQFASQEVLKMLQQDGLISEDEYKILNKTNFLYLDGEFKDRSVAVKLKGKGGKGKKLKLAPVPKTKDTIEILKLRRQKLPTLRLAPSRAKTPVLKLARSAKSEPKRLTVRKIRVK